jgi:hypothetical protein
MPMSHLLLLPLLSLASAPNEADLVVMCRGWAWACYQEILAQRCGFFDACCKRGFLVRLVGRHNLRTSND